jgi:isopentenyldiphosphate isomerase
LGFFDYFAQYGKFCENEHCAILIGEYNGPLRLNPKVGYSYKWIPDREFLQDIEENPKNYSPWAKESAKIIKKNKK